MVFMMILNYLLLKVALIGYKKDTPIAGCRKTVINYIFYICWRLIGVVALFTWHTHKYLSENEVSYEEYLGTREIVPVLQSLGSVMKEFYYRPEEHSSRLIRQNTGKEFVRQGSLHLKKDQLDSAINFKKRVLDGDSFFEDDVEPSQPTNAK